MSARYDVLVLGGGIIGSAIAWELAQRGQSVCLIERGTIGCEASKAAAGILSAQMDLERPGAFFELCQASRRLYTGWVKRLEHASGIHVEYAQDGILFLAFTHRDVATMQTRMRWQQRRGLTVERWSPSEVRRHEPNVEGRFKAGFCFPTEAQVDNAKLMQALSRACRKVGVSVLEQTEIRRLLTRAGRVIGVQPPHQTLRASSVVNCLGSWASISGMQRLKLPVVPAKGQMLSFDAPKRLFHRTVMSEAAYGVQRRDGRLIVGSTVEFVGFDRHLTLAGMHRILSGFRQMVRPSVFDRSTFREAWVGFRPCSQDRLPILGPTRIEGLYAALGHFRHGILLAPITATLLTEFILTGESSVDLQPFSPARFR